MNFSQFLTIVIGAIFVNNFVLSKFLGLCPFFGISRKTSTAVGMGMAVTFVTTMASIISWAVYRYLLLPYDLWYLRTPAFILIIAAFVQLVEFFIHRYSPVLFKAFGIYLPLITTNCVVMGVAVLNSDMFFKNAKPVAGSFMLTLVQGFAVGAGYTLALLLMSGIRERLDYIDIPESLKGFSIAFIIAGLMSLAFLGFSGFKV
jgi:electron transport complex protein RnfA